MTEAKKKTVTPERQYWKELHALCDSIYAKADVKGWDTKVLAAKAHLCVATVLKLKNRITRWPRFHTVWKLAKAVGLLLVLEQRVASTRERRKTA